MKFTTDLKRAVGTGSSRAGTQHHWQMILSSISLLFAVPVVVFVFGAALGGSHDEVIAFLSRPLVAIALGISLALCIRHFMNEALEAIEDYVHGVPGKLAMFATTAVSYILIFVGLFALAKIAL